MVITLKVFATLRKKYQNVQALEIGEPAKVRDIFGIIDLNPEAVSIIMVNGIRVDIEKELIEGDTLALFPPVGGG